MRYAPHPFKVGFRNKHTTTRLRSPINKHLSKIIVFTIRQRKIIRPKTARINIICILHHFHVQNHNYVKYAYRIATVFDCGKRLKAQQSSKKMYVSTSWKYYHSSRTSLLVEKNNVSPLKKTTTLFNPCQSFFTVRFDGYFFTIKNHLRADDYATTVCAIKSTQLKQGQTTRYIFFNARTVSVAIWQTI